MAGDPQMPRTDVQWTGEGLLVTASAKGQIAAGVRLSHLAPGWCRGIPRGTVRRQLMHAGGTVWAPHLRAPVTQQKGVCEHFIILYA